MSFVKNSIFKKTVKKSAVKKRRDFELEIVKVLEKDLSCFDIKCNHIG